MNEPTLAPGVSVVVPVYNSETTLVELVRRIELVLGELPVDYEILLIDDGSHDGSWSVIEQLARQRPCVRGFNLMRNYGQHNAVLCGLRSARFDVTVTLDDDLQHPPEEIPRLLARLREGHDVVYGTPREMPHSWWRNWTSAVAKRGMARLFGNAAIGKISAFRALRTGLRKALDDFRSPRLSLDLLLSWGTQKFVSEPVLHMPRKSGKSNYSFVKLVDLTLVTLTSYSTTPLRLASFVGFMTTAFGLVALAYVLARWAIEGSVPGFSFLASVICLFSGAQMFTLGIIGEYLARMYTRSQDRPTYVVQDCTPPSDAAGESRGPLLYHANQSAA